MARTQANKNKRPKNSVVINGQTIGKDEKILIEKGGKFELVSAGKLKGILPEISNKKTPQGRPTTSTTTVKMASIKKDKISTPKPPEKKVDKQPQKSIILGRPNIRSAGPERPKRRAGLMGLVRKSHSADGPRKKGHPRSRSAVVDKHDIVSPYAMSPELKKAMKKLAATEAAKRREEEKQRQLEEEEALKAAESAWKAWLEKKNDEHNKDKKKSESKENQRKIEMRKHQEAVAAFNAWVKSKRLQGRKERLLKQQEQIEQDELWYVRERKECNRAFNRWLRQKQQDVERQKQLETESRKQTRKAAKRAKRTNALMKDIMAAQQMKYIEYYGYRF